MKKKIIFTLGILLIGLIVFMVYVSIEKLDKKKAIEHTQNDFLKLLSQLGRSDVDSTLPTILFFFNSECEHCQWEMKQVSENISDFENYQILLISYEPENEAISFLDSHNLSQYYLQATSEKITSAFTGGVPQTLIYNEGKLVRHFKGEVKMEAILESLPQK